MLIDRDFGIIYICGRKITVYRSCRAAG